MGLYLPRRPLTTISVSRAGPNHMSRALLDLGWPEIYNKVRVANIERSAERTTPRSTPLTRTLLCRYQRSLKRGFLSHSWDKFTARDNNPRLLRCEICWPPYGRSVTCRIASPPPGLDPTIRSADDVMATTAGEESGESLWMYATHPHMTANPGTAHLRRPGSRGVKVRPAR
jgi:hypothetical protein